MRVIGTLNDEQSGLNFSAFLHQQGIAHQLEIQTNTDWGSSNYGSIQCQIWIYDEDQVNEALKWFHLFKENPQDPIFQPIKKSTPLPQATGADTPPPQFPLPSSQQDSQQQQIATAWETQPMGWMTRALLIICCLLFSLAQLLTPSTPIPARYAGLTLFTSPVEKALLYDYPKFYELVSRFIRSYGYEGLGHPEELPTEEQYLMQQINHTPFWQGAYSLLLKGGVKAVEKGFIQYPMFEKIKEGQVWRLFTPCLLHGDIFHLFFNMLWLIVLGKQIEQRIKAWPYVLFILIIGVLSNTVQYLMSGPNFIGFSGILCGMLAFIWVRQKRAAWEGYQIDRLTFLFMLIFIISMAFIQLLSFFLEKSMDLALSPNIANMAHLTGGLTGYLLGKLNFFSWRHT